MIERARLAALIADGVGDAPVTVRARDLVVRDVLVHDRLGVEGHGVWAIGPAEVTIERAWIERASTIAVVASGEAARVTLRDGIIRDTNADREGARGMGLGAHDRAEVALDRVAVVRARGVGAGAIGAGTTLRADDLSVRDTQVDGTTERDGRGVEIGDGAALVGRRVAIEGATLTGLSVLANGASADVEDLRVTGTRAAPCAETTCVGRAMGTGVVAGSARVSLRRFSIARSALCGLQIAAGSEVTLADGEIAEGEIGVNLQDPSVDFGALTASVRLRDNARAVDAAALPVPTPDVPRAPRR